MDFESLVNKGNVTLMNLFTNCDVSIILSGTQVKSIRAIYDQANEVVSPFDASQISVKPTLTVLDTDFSGITSASTLAVKKDNESFSKDYKFDGKPRSDGTGVTIIHLADKK